MQNLELLLLIASTVYLLFNRTTNKLLSKSLTISLLLLVLSLHLIFEGYRWQMIPIYGIWVVALITAIRQPQEKASTWLRILQAVGITVLLALALILPSALPVFELPATTGPYSVGTTDIFLQLDREEVITEDPKDKRSLMIKAWYPSEESTGEEDLYVDVAGRNGFAQKYGLSTGMLNYLDKVETNVFRNIPIANETFPVLIFSHGYNSKANSYYALLSEMVSHGYVVFAINHTYESTGATFPDGTLKYFDYDYAQKIESGTWESMAPLVEVFKNGLPFEERHPIIREALTTYFVRGMVERWTDDILDVVSELEDWNSDGFFAGKLDLSKVGAFGHSRGGGAAGNATLVDRRITAGANIDGVQWGQIVDTAHQDPFLFVSADWPADHEDLNSHAYINKSTSTFYKAMIHGSAHSNFMDIPLMVPFRSLSQAGTVDPRLSLDLTNQLVVTFFDKHLKGRPVDLATIGAKHEMLDVEIFKGDAISSKLE